MRKLFLSAMAFAAMMSAISLTSCSNDDDNTGNGDGNGGDPSEMVELKGIIEGTTTLDANKVYHLTGTVTVPEGATLQIPAGTKIKAAKGFDKYILVAQGGKIEARGTADRPIVFTADSEDATSGYWGGLIINGKAPISGDTEGQTGATEIDNNQPYGGTDASDNSGVIEYVQLLYTGARSSADIEHNGLTLNGVGNGTTINNLYIAEGADDAIEFFGGSVNVTNLLAVNCDDDMFDFTQGYNGTLTNCYGVWESGFTSTEEDPRGVEADGNLDGNGPDHKHQSDFTINGMTIANYSDTQSMQDAIKIRRGATAHITNALVAGTGSVENIIDLTDGKGGAGTATEISLTNNATKLTSDAIKSDAEYPNVKIEDGNTGADAGTFAWTGYEFGKTNVESADIPLEITSEVTLDAAKQYYINGAVHVKDGGVLNIPAGMTIKAKEGFGNYIIVERGGKIFAEGTENAPITFTADANDDKASFW